ncbi:hypothetical protein ACAN107058_20945 [Paracidovorax anthurii]
MVLDGLKAGDKVMVDGFQKLPRGKPGDPIVVQPVPWQAAGGAAPGAGGAPAPAGGASAAQAPASAPSAPAKQ